MARYEKYPKGGALLCATVLLAGGAGFSNATQAGALAIGPVQQVNAKSSTLVVLGQTYSLASSARISASGSAVTLRSLKPGTLVAVYGTESPHGAVDVLDVVALPQLNVPGATHLVVTGIVSAVSNVGTIRIGGLSVDINATLTSDTPTASVGDLVQLTGTQPTSGGLFLAQGIEGSGASKGIEGSGAASLGIEGSGASKGIEVSGASSLGIDGSGASKGIEGSGAASLGIVG
ncbi:MAG: DUF5666 domain-containing protein, partial [Steroidobacteraceae bacterium]